MAIADRSANTVWEGGLAKGNGTLGLKSGATDDLSVTWASRTESALFVIPVPGTNVTVADVRSSSGGWPASARAPESAIAKQEACAAASRSSGLVRPCGSSAREVQVTGSGATTPLVVESIVPLPSSRLPCQVTSAVRCVAIVVLPVVPLVIGSLSLCRCAGFWRARTR